MPDTTPKYIRLLRWFIVAHENPHRNTPENLRLAAKTAREIITEYESWLGDNIECACCGNQLTEVRPGKWQCDHCPTPEPSDE